MTANKTLKITETEPVTIVKDFGTFTEYIKENNPSLVRKGHFLTRKTLYEIDQVLSNPDPENTPETPKIFYPHLNLFYYLALRRALFVKTSKLHLQQTERLTDYEQLTPTEKYFSLLETLWVDADWRELLREGSSLFFMPDAQTIIGYLARTPGKVISAENSEIPWKTFSKMYFLLQYLSVFGLIQITFDTEGVTFKKGRKLHYIASVTTTDLGSALLPILYSERNLEEWNLQHTEEKKLNTLLSPDLDQEQKKKEPFFKPFQKFFRGELQKTLSRGEHRTGTFTFKVSLRKKLWRTIVVSSEHTLEDFHEAIQDAFDFDKDHLYAFFTDGIPWSHNRIMAPQDTPE